MKLLIVVDMQKDFVDGSLGTKEAVGILPKVIDKVRNFRGEIVFTKDTHPVNYLETQEGRNLPVEHCIRGSEGWMLSGELEELARARGSRIIEKPTFGSVELGELLRSIGKEEELEQIELCGLCTDICVISNALLAKAFLPEVLVTVDASCCAGVTPESHSNAIQAMKMCQIQIVGEA